MSLSFCLLWLLYVGGGVVGCRRMRYWYSSSSGCGTHSSAAAPYCRVVQYTHAVTFLKRNKDKMGTSSQSTRAVATALAGLGTVAVGTLWWHLQNARKTESGASTTGSSSEETSTTTTPKADPVVEEDYGDTTAPMREIRLSEDGDLSGIPKRGRVLSPNTITIVHGSVTGTCAKLAQELFEILTAKGLIEHQYSNIQIGKLEEWDWWDELLNNESEEETPKKKNPSSIVEESAPPVLLVLLPTHHGGSWPPSATCLETGLQDLANDWRISKFPLKSSGLQVGIMGMGCSDYGDDSVGKPAREAFATFRQLGAAMMGRQVRIGDDATGNQDRVLQSWIHHDLLPRLVINDDEEEEEDQEADEEEPEVVDMEDLGHSMENTENENENTVKTNEPREMVTATQAKALKKEGYKLIGTHSAVKLCRWTKHQLRGRGGCYKHTFYGITSYQCMETTPSLACANKCVFCWRHHKNPVGKEWKWKTDDPYFIVDQAVKTHIQMIKETKGIPGVNIERWKEAHTVRHCALSLVGEPIMYPRINELLSDLHHRDISSFLVTNGQHPKSIGSLIPVTQLYVSVDAPTPESLIEIDRPLFSDAWERLQESLQLLKDKGQRTVARLTVVKGWNSEEIEGYAKLIALGKVSLIEVKGVTFCGKSDASTLNMSNSPWHHEVIQLVRTLKSELDKLREVGGPDAPPEYDLACEHKHSVSVLLARVDQFAYEAEDGTRRWKTWIDYDTFQVLYAKHKADPTFTFGVKDYVMETPAWALFGSEEEGFDPTDTRHRKKKKYPKYTRFDERGIPTHDDNDQDISLEERARLSAVMDQKMKEVGSGTTVTELKGGEKVIQDATLMFRGQTVVK